MKYHHDRLHRTERQPASGRDTISGDGHSERAATAMPGLLDGEGAPREFEQARCAPRDAGADSFVPDADRVGRPAS